MDTKKHYSFDKGMITLITQRLEQGTDPKEIESMLLRAGFDLADVQSAITYVVTNDTRAHQRLIEQSDFLPPLTKKPSRTESPLADVKEAIVESVKYVEDSKLGRVLSAEVRHKGLFSGRLRRKDFIMGILFFFGLGFVFFTIIITWIQTLSPATWNQIISFVEADTYGVWLICIPFMFAPITVMVLSLIARRLQNLELPGWFAFLYLFAFVSPFGALGGFSLWGIHTVLFILFILLISKKGHAAPNEHGAFPTSEGSIFGKIMGYDHAHHTDETTVSSTSTKAR